MQYQNKIKHSGNKGRFLFVPLERSRENVEVQQFDLDKSNRTGREGGRELFLAMRMK